GFFVDYTTGVAKKDSAMQDKAVQELTTQYVPQFSDFITSATGLDKNAVAGLVMNHVLTTKQVVDDQAAAIAAPGATSWSKAAEDDGTAAHHMQMIGDPLAEAIVNKLPSKF
ncbi:MAG: hypothetical protein ACREP9_09880, partial [Candidatus Dormibacteraceae bacterium]